MTFTDSARRLTARSSIVVPVIKLDHSCHAHVVSERYLCTVFYLKQTDWGKQEETLHGSAQFSAHKVILMRQPSYAHGPYSYSGSW